MKIHGHFIHSNYHYIFFMSFCLFLSVSCMFFYAVGIFIKAKIF